MWEVLICKNSFEGLEETGAFKTYDDAVDWVMKVAPDIILEPLEGFVCKKETSVQYGTNHRWAEFSKVGQQ